MSARILNKFYRGNLSPADRQMIKGSGIARAVDEPKPSANVKEGNEPMERVLFRTEHDKYTGEKNFLAIFPDAPANPGRIAHIAFRLFDDVKAVFEPLGKIDMIYYYRKTKIVRKGTETALRCLDTIKARYGGNFRVMEKYRNKKFFKREARRPSSCVPYSLPALRMTEMEGRPRDGQEETSRFFRSHHPSSSGSVSGCERDERHIPRPHGRGERPVWRGGIGHEGKAEGKGEGAPAARLPDTAVPAHTERGHCPQSGTLRWRHGRRPFRGRRAIRRQESRNAEDHNPHRGRKDRHPRLTKHRKEKKTMSKLMLARLPLRGSEMDFAEAAVEKALSCCADRSMALPYKDILEQIRTFRRIGSGTEANIALVGGSIDCIKHALLHADDQAEGARLAELLRKRTHGPGKYA